MSELLIVGSEQDNTRLDRFLADQYEEYTRSFLQKLIDQGNVSINGISVKKSGYSASKILRVLRFQSATTLLKVSSVPSDSWNCTS